MYCVHRSSSSNETCRPLESALSLSLSLSFEVTLLKYHVQVV
jgi:hypothetical protein